MESIIVGFIITALTFCGQQYAKHKQWKHSKEEQKIQLMKDLCYKKDTCGPLIKYVNSRKRKDDDVQ